MSQPTYAPEISSWRSFRRVPLRADPVWARPALACLLAATAVLYVWGLGASGWANAFYSAAVQAGAHSWKAFFFGSSDSANFITVDKTPMSLWPMELTARLFGVNSWSILIPQALMGVATVAVLHATVRRSLAAWGPSVAAAGALLSGAVLATTPVATLMFRFNNPDALLVLLLTTGAYALLRAREEASTGWLVLAAACVGSGFLTKMLQAFLVLPAFALVYAVTAPASLRRRLWQLTLAGVTLIVSAGWWVAIVALVPADSRPYVGGSQHNSVLELTLGYNGLGRLNGDETGGLGNTNQDAGWLRMFGPELGGQIAWLLPAALLLLAAGLYLTVRGPKTAGHTDRHGLYEEPSPSKREGPAPEPHPTLEQHDAATPLPGAADPHPAPPDLDPAPPNPHPASPDPDPASRDLKPSSPDSGLASSELDPNSRESELSHANEPASHDLAPASSGAYSASPNLGPSSSDGDPTSPDPDPASASRHLAQPDLDPASADRHPARPELDPASPEPHPTSPRLVPASPDAGPGPRTDGAVAAFALWGGWLLVTDAVFSLMQGIFHGYYTVALAPAVAALVGMGGAVLWHQRHRPAAAIALAVVVAVSAWWAYRLLGRTPDFVPWLRLPVLVGGFLAAVLLAARGVSSRVALTGAVLAVVACLAAPSAYAIDTAATAHQGAIPTAGPSAGFGGPGFPGGRPGGPGGARGGPGGTRGGFGGPPGTGAVGRGMPQPPGGGGSGQNPGAPGTGGVTGSGGNTGPGGGTAAGTGQGGAGGQSGQAGGTTTNGQSGGTAASGQGGTGGAGGGTAANGRSGTGGPGGGAAADGRGWMNGGGRFGGGMGGPGALLDGSTPSAALTALLKQNAGSYTWVAATVGSNSAAGYQLASDRPVMAIGGFNGTDPAPGLARFQQYVRAGKIHYFIAGSMARGAGTAQQITSWVAGNFTARTVGGTTVYDLSP